MGDGSEIGSRNAFVSKHGAAPRCRLRKLTGRAGAIGCGQSTSVPLQAARLPAANYPVIPVEPGIFSIVLVKRCIGIENGEGNQASGGQFR
jgi:hypothetical protein